MFYMPFEGAVYMVCFAKMGCKVGDFKCFKISHLNIAYNITYFYNINVVASTVFTIFYD